MSQNFYDLLILGGCLILCITAMLPDPQNLKSEKARKNHVKDNLRI